MQSLFKMVRTSLAIFVLYCSIGCEAEKDFIDNERMIVRKFSMSETSYKNDSKLNSVIEMVKSMKSSQGGVNSKIVYDENAGLYFDDEKGLYIQNGDKESYTFPIIRTSSLDKVQNICFSLLENGNYDVFLVKYDFTKEQAASMTEEQMRDRPKEFITLLKNSQAVNFFRYVCIDIVVYVSHEITSPIDQGELTGNFGYTSGSYTVPVVVASGCFFSDDTSSGSGNADGFNNGLGDGSATGDSTGSNGATISGGTVTTGSIIDDTEAENPQTMPLGWKIDQYENRLDEFELPIYEAHPELRDYLANNNCDIRSQQFVSDMILLFQNEEYTQEQKDVMVNLIQICGLNHATFTLDDTITGNNSTLDDINEHLATISEDNENLFESEYIPDQINNYTGRCKVSLNFMYGVRVSMNFTQTATGQYALSKENISSDLYGITAFTDWEQLISQSNVVNNFNGKIKVQLYGKLHQEYTIPFMEGININQFIKITLLIDRNSGAVESAQWQFD